MTGFPLESAKVLPAPEGAPPALACLVRDSDGTTYYAYRYKRCGLAVTIVLRDRRRNAILLVRRDIEPYRGMYSLPGGFIETGTETLEEAAAREVWEETGVKIPLEALRLVDVRSETDRDPRDHVVDVGFVAELDSAEAVAGPETSGVLWASAEEMETIPLAFDHLRLWHNAQGLLG